MKQHEIDATRPIGEHDRAYLQQMYRFEVRKRKFANRTSGLMLAFVPLLLVINIDLGLLALLISFIGWAVLTVPTIDKIGMNRDGIYQQRLKQLDDAAIGRA